MLMIYRTRPKKWGVGECVSVGFVWIMSVAIELNLGAVTEIELFRHERMMYAG